MALNPSRSALSSACRALRQCRQAASTFSQPARRLSSTPARPAEAEESERPRWSYTPEKMKAPFPIRVPKDPKRSVWKVNEDPDVLDKMYNRLLGPNGEKMLPDEIKWLAVTHKSFDGGRRGFNTRLAYYGRHVLALETTRKILTSPATEIPAFEDVYQREPFRNAALDNIDKLNGKQPQDIIDKDKIVKLAHAIGLHEVIRWKPRLPENLQASGVGVILNTALYAIVGAISLQHGAEVAQRVVRERILKRLETWEK
ncbi:ribonuclease 3 [Echria macrotheca]|uniref:Ribonuclease 3 n=1 Tax=Echria macrotheca TaxID=438768 RepID=A0AAJ0B2T2_9PEZI|nr:ribonuclease 3 [Echria macrotheca]